MEFIAYFVAFIYLEKCFYPFEFVHMHSNRPTPAEVDIIALAASCYI